MTTIAVVAKLTAAEGKADELEAVIKDLVAEVGAGEPDTAVYAAHRDLEDPAVFWFYERYATAEAAMAHAGGAPLQTAGQRMRGLLAGRPEIHRLAPVATHGLAD